MPATTRATWSAAYQVATAEDLDAEVSAVRRTLRVRRALGLVLSLVALLVPFTVVQHLVDPDLDELWTVPRQVLRGGYGLVGVGFALTIIGNVRTTGAGRTFVEPVDLLSRTGRAWLRAQVREGRLVPVERRAVVGDAAHRMLLVSRYTPTYLGQALLFVGGIILLPFPTLLIAFPALAVWSLVRVVRRLVWSSRARRWLALNA